MLSESYLSGNELLVAITAAVFELFDSASLHAGKVAGFGLLFQEDMKASEFNVMYSTGFSSASISLREALITQFRVPVTEEYSQVYTVSRALEQRENVEAENTAHIAIGERVLASITLSDGRCRCGKVCALMSLRCFAATRWSCRRLKRPQADAEETGLLPARQERLGGYPIRADFQPDRSVVHAVPSGYRFAVRTRCKSAWICRAGGCAGQAEAFRTGAGGASG